MTFINSMIFVHSPYIRGCLRGLTGNALDHRSLPSWFKYWHIWRVFHLLLRFINLGHLAYHVHKSGCKTSIIVVHIVDLLVVREYPQAVACLTSRWEVLLDLYGVGGLWMADRMWRQYVDCCNPGRCLLTNYPGLTC